MDPPKSWKTVEAGREHTANNAEDDPLPAYEAEDTATPSTLPEVSPTATPSRPPKSLSPAVPSNLPESYSPAIGPSVSSPFNFPTRYLPPYSDPTHTQKPIAIPQRWPEPSAPFLTAYAPILLNYGIPAKTFYSFLDTLSAFLTAKVSNRAISHAGDIAASVGRVPKQLGKDLVAQAKDTGRGIASSAKNGNPMGVVGGLIGGTFGMTIGVALRTVNSIMQLPAAAAMAAANPKTPRGRADLYIATANRDWFGPRGLNARLLDTTELTNLLGIATPEFLVAAGPAVSTGNADEKLKALRRWIGDLEVRDSWRDWGTLSRRDTPSTMPDPEQAQVVNTVDAFSVEPIPSASDPATGLIRSSTSRDAKKDMEKKDMEKKDLEKKDMEKKDTEKKDMQKKDMEKKDVEKMDMERKDAEKRDVEERGVERRDVEKKDVEREDVEKKDVETTMPSPISPVDTTSAFSVSPVDTTSAFSIITNRDHVDTANAFSIEPKHNVDTNSAFSIEEESSVTAGKRPVQSFGQEKGTPLPPGSLRLGFPTLWLVLFPAERTLGGKEKFGKQKW
ncbi:hypothetical protein Vi05172_g10275 [Venturia inaequalis]|nr:hypothetical protein Vi05172_g10275 [Venturia inaequalis]